MPSIDLSSELPAPRKDEPSSLRQDIFDELADHLDCSLAREQVKTADEALAHQRVLEKFGNPASIARKLWRDAMWETIIMHRLSFVLMGLMTSACILLAVLMWRTEQSSRKFQADQDARQEAFLLSLAEKLKSEPAVPPVAPLPAGWGDVSVKLVDKNGHPVNGLVQLQGPATPESSLVPARDPRMPGSNPSPAGSRMVLRQAVDEKGITMFRGVPYGELNLTAFVTSTNAQTTWVEYFRPGVLMFEKQCPTTSRQPANVRFKIDVPEDLRQVPFRYLIKMKRELGYEIEKEWWTIGELPFVEDHRQPHFLMDQTGSVVGYTDSNPNFDHAQTLSEKRLVQPAPLLCVGTYASVEVVGRFQSDVWRPLIGQSPSLPPKKEAGFMLMKSDADDGSNSIQLGSLPMVNGESVVEIGVNHDLWKLARQRNEVKRLFGRKAEFDANGDLVPLGTPPLP